ncbi:unnamed protein product [Phytomonas sp. Hart1]|nr:unnamed protein product [Phytomonas sp. Hart1]|eukprot:CCW72011.1 unnamed protein product [Phytomonas sp. isolate Hart1]
MENTSGQAKIEHSEPSFPIPRERKRKRQPASSEVPRYNNEIKNESRSNSATFSLSEGQSIPSFVDVDDTMQGRVPIAPKAEKEQEGTQPPQPSLFSSPFSGGGLYCPEGDPSDSNSNHIRAETGEGSDGTSPKRPSGPDPLNFPTGKGNGNNGTISATAAQGSTVNATAAQGSTVSSSPHGFGEARRMKQPTLAVYGVVSDTAALRQEIAHRDAQVEELQEKLTRALRELSEQRAHLRAEEHQTKGLQARLGRFQHTLRAELRRAAVQGRHEARRQLHQRHFELGHVVAWQGGVRQMWMEGSVVCKLIHELEEVSRRRDAVEGLKKAAHHTVKQLLRQERDRDESTPGSEGFNALMEAQEELQLRSTEHAALTAMIGTIRQRQVELENEKKAFVKEVRRINDEDASEYVSHAAIGDGERYILMDLLGKGGFSEVWRAFDLAEGRYVACKIHHVNRDWPMATRLNYRRRAERELEIMRVLDHPRLTRLYDVFPLNNTVFVSVMEYSAGMDLDTYLKRYQQMREADARLILLQVVAALRYLSGLPSPVIHYDLKPANILLHSADPGVLDVKITDFGLSKIIAETREGPSDNPSIELTSQGTGTYWYLPPECFDTSSTPRISNKVDVWSVGVIFYQMLFGRRPFAEGESQRKIWQEKLIIESARTLNFPESPKVSEEAKELMTNCLAFNAGERYDVFQLSQHPYLFRTGRRSTKVRNTFSSAPSVDVTPSSGVNCSNNNNNGDSPALPNTVLVK